MATNKTGGRSRLEADLLLVVFSGYRGYCMAFSHAEVVLASQEAPARPLTGKWSLAVARHLAHLKQAQHGFGLWQQYRTLTYSPKKALSMHWKPPIQTNN